MQRGVGGSGDAVHAAGDPAVEIVFLRHTADAQRGIVTGLQRKGLALFEPRSLVLVKNGDMALHGFDRAAVIVIVQPETASAVGFHREIAAGNAEVVLTRRIDIEGSAALAEDQARGACAVIQR